MPLNPAILAPALVVASGVTDPIGIAGWTAIAGVFVAWTIPSVIVNPLGGTPMIAIGPLITGTGALVVVVPPVTLGLMLAAASASVDPAGIAKWTAVATEYARWLMTCGVNTTGLIAYAAPPPAPSPGPVAGVGLLQLVGTPDFPTAVGVTDPPGMANWSAVASAVALSLQAAIVTPSMMNPGVGGPVTGTGSIS